VGSGLWVVGMGELRGLGFGVWVLSFGFWVLVRRGGGRGEERKWKWKWKWKWKGCVVGLDEGK